MGYSIAIAGCGVAGLTAGFLLARQGHHVTLFEQSSEVGPVGAGVLLQPLGQMALANLGWLGRVVERAERIERLHAITHKGRTLIDLPYGELAEGLCAYGLHRGDLFSVLHAEAVAAGVKIMLDSRVVKFVDRADGVEIFNHREESCGLYDFLIAADGARSTLRNVSGLRPWVHDYPHGALWVMGNCSVVRNKLLQVTHGSRQLCGLLPMGKKRCSLFWAVRKDGLEQLYLAGFDQWRREVLKMAPAAEEMLMELRSFEQTQFSTYQHVYMRRWSAGHVVFLGDAAHAMSPHLGQGINLALLDGLAFAKAMECCGNRGSGALTGVFGVYEKLRRAHTNYYAVVTFLLSPFFQSRGMIKGLGRDIVLPVLPYLPFVRSQMLMTMAGMKRSMLGGRMELP
jgi:2-polyprenyl-6-methoxyphenol hydroxylase-like FAD-dependent oxidoreductase